MVYENVPGIWTRSIQPEPSGPEYISETRNHFCQMPTALPTLRSDHFRSSHYATVFAILGTQTPRVEAKGTRFYNVDRWTVRFLTAEICQWAKQNPGVCPTRSNVVTWVSEANSKRVYPNEREIVTAAIPAELTVRIAMSLIGGGNHEGFHTKYSCRRNLTVDEIVDIVLPRWALVADWSKVEQLLQAWNNVTEDIRIERCGNEEYPGVHVKMCDLQDFILDQEAAERVGRPAPDPLNIAMMAFRDIGLGYHTSKQKAALETYDAFNPEVMKFVCEGPLSPFLDQAIALTATDDTGCLRLSLDIVACLAQIANPDDIKEAQDKAKQGSPTCPKCGAKGDKLVARPLSDGRGGHKPGKLVLVCTVCGWQDEIDMPPAIPQPKDTKPDQGDSSIKTLVSEMLSGTPTVQDSASVLANAIQSTKTKEDDSCQTGERPYRPYCTNGDVVSLVKPSPAGIVSDTARASNICQAIKTETAFLRTRLMRLVRAMEQRGITHGVRHGRELSDRMLVDSYTSILSGKPPSRAYQQTGERKDTSMAAVMVIDQSISMAGERQVEATKGMMAVCDPLDSLGCATMAVGFRTGHGAGPVGVPATGLPGYHRTGTIDYDVFKTFGERFATVKWRFANVRAEGGTPMADGIQFGLDALRSRKEGHRVLFVFTDGQPDPAHAPVIRRQIRLAREAGIYVIGVGIGPASKFVETMFPDHVYAPTFGELPKLLIAKLECLMTGRGPR